MHSWNFVSLFTVEIRMEERESPEVYGKMNLRAVSGIMLTLLLIGMLTFAFNSPDVKADGSWVWVKDTVTGAYGEAVVGTGDVIYIARKTNFYRYDPLDNSWTTLAAPPNPDPGDAFKTGTALAWDFGDYIYSLYGAATPDSRRWFYRYSISSNSWEILANTTADQGEGDAITWVGVDNCIYATIGGEQRPTYFVRYEPSTNSWSDEPVDPPAGMGDGASLVWTGGNLLYALRGEYSESSPLYDFWRYNLTDDTWTAMANVPADPQDGGIGGVGDGGSLLYVGLWLPDHTDYIYALSGNQANELPDNRTYRYTISVNNWERLADLPFGVGYYVGCRLGYADGYIYAWQGAPSTWTGGGDDLARYELLTDSTPPAISTLSPENKTYAVEDVPLTFTVNETTSWIGYSLNGQANTTIFGNTTLPSLLDGSHYIVVYSNDTFGNMGGSNTVYFTVDTTPPNIMAVSQNPPKNNVLPENEVNVTVTVTDYLSVVEQVTLNYTNGNGTWVTKNMTNLEGNVWNGIIPAFEYCTYVNYTIVAEDGVGNIITTEEVLGYQYDYHVIPEFPSFFILPLFMIATPLAVIICRRKFKKVMGFELPS